MFDFPTVRFQDLPLLNREEMAEVDRLTIDLYHVELLQMMENAGRNLARLAAERFISLVPGPPDVLVLAGRGGNGGGAMACARRLHGWGITGRVVLARPPQDHQGATAHQLASLTEIGVPILMADQVRSIGSPDLIIDGLLGYGLSGEPGGSSAELIQWANTAASPILALDLPSGLDATLGNVHQQCIRAEATLTLAAPKRGLSVEGAADHVGELYLADIGIPPEVYAALNLDTGWGGRFAESEILRVTPPDPRRRE